MRKLLLGLTFAMIASVAQADYTMVVPQKPGGGTSVWAEIVAKELEKYLGEDINIKHIPGARDIPGFNAWHNEMRDDDKVIMVSHGGNGVAFLQENVDYDYRQYESVGLMNLNIIAGKRVGADMSNPSFAAGSGQTPEAYAFTMLICGPTAGMQAYIDCFKENVTWVKGMSGSERRLAFKRGELNGTRENPAAYKKHGEFYDAYKLVKSFRDGMQKALWVNKGNPNATVLQAALRAMSRNPESRAIIEKKVGQYDWKIGAEGNAHRDTLMTLVTVDALKDLVLFNTQALGLASVFKADLASK